MARTYRLRNQGFREADALWDFQAVEAGLPDLVRVSRHSPQGRALLARLHGDHGSLAAPRGMRRLHEHRLRRHNGCLLGRCAKQADFEPVFIVRHRHSARHAWRGSQ